MNTSTALSCAMGCLLAGKLWGDPTPASTNTVPTNGLSLDWVIGEVLNHDPALKGARANWEAMKERIPQARAWEDPRAGLNVNAGRFVEVPANSFTDQSLMLEQTLPISGRNRLRGAAASAEAVGAYEELHRSELDAVAKARTAYYELASAIIQSELNETNASLLRQFVEISRSKFEAGARSESDVLSAETELARLEEGAFDFQRQISDAQTELNTLMDRPPQSPVGRPTTPDFQPVGFDREKVESLALSNRPELFIAEQKITAAKARLEAARREWVPEPAFQVEGDRYNEASQVVSEVTAGFSLDLPWFNRAKYHAEVRENQKLVEAAEQELEAARNETLGLIRDQLEKVETFHHHTELFQSKLLPLAEQTVTAKRLGYETDKSTFLELLSAQQTVEEVETMYWDHFFHYQIARAELEAIVGAPLEPAITEHHHDTK